MRFFYIFSTFLIVSINCAKYPLCSTNCQCSFADQNNSAKIICQKNVKELLSQDSTWINPDNNESYPYIEITLTNQKFIDLNFTFPKSELTYLNLAFNDIYKIKDNVFKNLQSMQVLILSNNDLEILSPNALQGQYLPERFEPLRSLIELRLDHNRLHTLNQDFFEHTTDLKILDLSYNPFKLIDQHTLFAIDSLAYLEELYLSNTEIVTLPDGILHTPKYLRILDLSGNPIDEIPATLAESHNLTALYLNNTNFVNLTKENGFPMNIPSIKILHLCQLKNLERIEREALSGLINLEELLIRDNIKLNYLDQFALAKFNEKETVPIWPFIRKLNIGNNKLSYLNGDFVALWERLVELDIRANPWTCECENQWLVDTLIPVYMKIDSEKASQVRCGAPVEMVEFTLLELQERKYKMRCLDNDGAQPEKDAAMLVGIFAGVLVAIPLILFGIYAYQRKWFGLLNICDKSAAAYSRRYYSTTANDENF